MSVIAKLFQKNRNKPNIVWNSSGTQRRESRSVFSEEDVRVIVFKNHALNGHSKLFDSHESEEQPAPAEQNKKGKCNTNSKTDRKGKPYKRQISDSKMLGEMVFGSEVLAYKGSSFKVHIIREPPQLMITKVFTGKGNDAEGGGRNSLHSSCSSLHSTDQAGVDAPIDDISASLTQSLPITINRQDEEFAHSLDSYNSGSLRPSLGVHPSSLGVHPSPGSSAGTEHSFAFKRWQRSCCTSLEYNNVNRGQEDAQSLDSLSVPVRQRPPRFGLCVLFALDDQKKPKRVPFEEFLFAHITLVESHVERLVTSVRNNYSKQHLNVKRVEEEKELFFNSVSDLYSAPRLDVPVWLEMISHPTQKMYITQEYFKHLVMCWDKYEGRGSANHFLSSLLTVVLTNHLAWVSTVAPTNSYHAKNYFDKHTAKWLETLAKTHPYNPLWAQLGDLYGAIGSPRLSRTVVTGTNQRIVYHILLFLSYFIRCSQLHQIRKESLVLKYEHLTGERSPKQDGARARSSKHDDARACSLSESPTYCYKCGDQMKDCDVKSKDETTPEVEQRKHFSFDETAVKKAAGVNNSHVTFADTVEYTGEDTRARDCSLHLDSLALNCDREEENTEICVGSRTIYWNQRAVLADEATSLDYQEANSSSHEEVQSELNPLADPELANPDLTFNFDLICPPPPSVTRDSGIGTGSDLCSNIQEAGRKSSYQENTGKDDELTSKEQTTSHDSSASLDQKLLKSESIDERLLTSVEVTCSPAETDASSLTQTDRASSESVLCNKSHHLRESKSSDVILLKEDVEDSSREDDNNVPKLHRVALLPSTEKDISSVGDDSWQKPYSCKNPWKDFSLAMAARSAVATSLYPKLTDIDTSAVTKQEACQQPLFLYTDPNFVPSVCDTSPSHRDVNVKAIYPSLLELQEQEGLIDVTSPKSRHDITVKIPSPRADQASGWERYGIKSPSKSTITDKHPPSDDRNVTESTSLEDKKLPVVFSSSSLSESTSAEDKKVPVVFSTGSPSESTSSEDKKLVAGNSTDTSSDEQDVVQISPLLPKVDSKREVLRMTGRSEETLFREVRSGSCASRMTLEKSDSGIFIDKYHEDCDKVPRQRLFSKESSSTADERTCFNFGGSDLDTSSETQSVHESESECEGETRDNLLRETRVSNSAQDKLKRDGKIFFQRSISEMSQTSILNFLEDTPLPDLGDETSLDLFVENAQLPSPEQLHVDCLEPENPDHNTDLWAEQKEELMSPMSIESDKVSLSTVVTDQTLRAKICDSCLLEEIEMARSASPMSELLEDTPQETQDCSPTQPDISEPTADCSEPTSNSREPVTLEDVPIPLSPTSLSGSCCEAIVQKDFNFGYSMLAGFSRHYMSDFVLQGTCQMDLHTRMYDDLMASLSSSVLDEPIQEAVCVVADTEKWTVKEYTCSRLQSDRVQPRDVQPSRMVADALQSTHQLFRLKMSPEFCMMHLEDRLQEMFFKSRLLLEYRKSSCVDLTELPNLLGIDPSDLGLIEAISQITTEYSKLK